MNPGDRWESRKYPQGCRSCGQTRTDHRGQGLCARCYRDEKIRNAALDGTLVEFEFPPIVKSVETDSSEEWTSGERPPGSFSPPSESVTAPIAEPKSLFARILGPKEERPKVTVPPTRETRPKGSSRRVSTADSLTDLWSALGGAAQRIGRAPLGRYLQWQSPAAGQMIDEALAGTFVDRKLLQPAVKARGRIDLLAAIVGPPAIILQIERNPASAAMMIPILKSSIRRSLPTMLPAMKKAQAKEEKLDEAVREMFPDIPAGVDPVDMVIEQMFYGFGFGPEAATEEARDEQFTGN